VAERVRGPRGIVGVRTDLIVSAADAATPKLSRYFSGMERRMRLRKSLDPPAGWKARGEPTVNWRREKRLLTEVLEPLYALVGEATFGVVSDQIGAAVVWDLNARNVQTVMKSVGVQVTNINDASREMIRKLVRAEIERGSNADVLESQLRTLVRSWAGLSGPVSMSEEDRRRLSRAEALARSRAHSIALTESGNAYNRAAIAGYRESGLVTQVRVYDGPDCGWSSHDDSDLAHGSTRTLNEAQATPLSHPHCQRAFGPQVQRTVR
jgi:hypothetical protein